MATKITKAETKSEAKTETRTRKRVGSGAIASKAIRWSLNSAAREFGIHREQLDRRRRGLGIEPGEDECYSTRDIAALVFGDKEAEAIGKLSAERQMIEHELTRKRGEVMPVESVERVALKFIVTARQRILSSSMSEQEKDDVLCDLVALGDVDWSKEARGANRKAR